MKKKTLLIVTLVLTILGGFAFVFYTLLNRSELKWQYPGIFDKQAYSHDLFEDLLLHNSDTVFTELSDSISIWPGETSQSLIYYFNTLPNSNYYHLQALDSLVQEGAHVASINASVENLLLWNFTINGDTSLLTISNLFYGNTKFDSTFVLKNIHPKSNQLLNYGIPSNWVQMEIPNSQIHGTFSYAILNDTLQRKEWKEGYIHKSVLDTLFPNAVVTSHLTNNSNRVTSFDIPRGKGMIHLYLQPCVFTNYAVSNPSNAAFIADVISSWPAKGIVIDEYSGMSERAKNESELGKSPLQFILSFPTLRWAWYLLLISLFVFILFRTQRRQRIVPIIKGRQNQSLEFAKSIGTLQYKSKSDHEELTAELFRHFRNWAKRRTRSSGGMNEELQFHLRGMLPEFTTEIERLFELHAKFEKDPTSISTNQLSEIYSITRYIYNHV